MLIGARFLASRARYDDGSIDDSKEIMAPFVAHGIVTWIDYDNGLFGIQLLSLNECRPLNLICSTEGEHRDEYEPKVRALCLDGTGPLPPKDALVSSILSPVQTVC